MKIVTIWKTSQGFFTRKEDCICYRFYDDYLGRKVRETPTEHYAIYDDGKYWLLDKPIPMWRFPKETKENEE